MGPGKVWIFSIFLVLLKKLQTCVKNIFKTVVSFVFNTIKTLPRDFRAFYRLLKLNIHLFLCQGNNESVGKLFDEAVKNYPDKVCFYFEDEKWTYLQVQEYSNKVGNYFLENGYKKGDCIALMMANRPKFIFIWLGLSKIGVISSWINFNLRHQSLVHCIKTGNSTAVIFGPEYRDAIIEISGDKGLPLDLTWFSYGKSTHSDIQTKPAKEFETIDLMEALVDSPSNNPKPSEKINFDDVLCYIFTSGTTGLPKAAIMTHSRAISLTYGVHYMLVINEKDILYTPLPLYHVQGGIIGVGQALFCGTSQVIIRKFSASNYWRDCIRYDVTASQYLGEICRYLLRQPSIPEERMHSVRRMFGNGMRPELWKPFVKRFNSPCIMEVYGSTEGNCQMGNFEGVIGACGSSPYGIFSLIAPSPIGLYKIDKESGELLRNPKTGLAIPCGKNEPGEMLGRIANSPLRAFFGYTDPNATTLKTVCNVQRKYDKYFRSGDLLMLNEQNYYHYVDRLGSSYRWKGETISSEEVASTISGAIGLKEVVVFGIFIPHSDGKPGMVVIANPDGPSAEELAEKLSLSLKELLPSYAKPLFLRFVNAIDKTGTHKLQKSILEKEGFDISVIKDPLYCLHGGKYVSLDDVVYSDIMKGNIRF